MKKGLLLSVVASTMIFAGGDIAPVEPAAAAPAADCSDFYGSVGIYYQSQTGYYLDANNQVQESSLFSDEATNNLSATAVIGVEKALFGGIGFGAEVAGYSTLGLDINDAGDAHVDGPRTGTREGGVISELFLTASFNNTAVKVGRFALPGSLSPFAYAGRTAGVYDQTFEGALVANTDLADTTVFAVYAKNVVDMTGARNAVGVDDLGLFALGFSNKSLANTTITATGYYVPDAAFDTAGDTLAVYAGFLTANTTYGDYKVDFQAAYVDGDLTVGNVPGGVELDATYAIGAKISAKYGMFDASLAATYVNDGDYALAAPGTASFWLYTASEFDYSVSGLGATTAVVARVGAKVGPGKLYALAGYWTEDDTQNTEAMAARIGYKLKVSGIDMKAEYRYRNITDDSGLDVDRNRVRLEAAYKF